MIVLGLFGFGMNPAACLLKDGKLIAFCEEERFARVKSAPDRFPGQAVGFCLERAQLCLSEVDRIAFAWDTGKYPFRMFAKLAGQYARHRGRAQHANGSAGQNTSTVSSALLNVLKYTPGRLAEEIRLGLRHQGLQGAMPEIEFVPHHKSHAFSTYFASSFDQALVLTLDGSGEDICTQVAVGRGDRLEVEESIPIPHSLGWYYAAFTAYFGFRPYQHEGKLMGLAGLGFERSDDNPWVERLEALLPLTDTGYEVDPIYTRFGRHSQAERFTDHLVEFLTDFDSDLVPLSPDERHRGASAGGPAYLRPAYVDLAWGVQARLELVVKRLAERAARAHGNLRQLCIAGGVGLNCKMNGSLLRSPAFDEVFVQPASNDAGTAIGAAMYVAQQAGDVIRAPLQHTYYGPESSDEEIGELLRHCKLHATECEDIAASVAAELERGRLVGWYQGRAEYGPRALGARSILANPAVAGVSDQLNLRVKGREPWRPFCPSILEDQAPAYFEGCQRAPFMTTAFNARPERREELAAVCHVDGSTRPQTVHEGASPTFHRLLSEFRGRTGLPYVINTSFNFAGEPIVASPREALRAYFSTGLDSLALGNFLLTKDPDC